MAGLRDDLHLPVLSVRKSNTPAHFVEPNTWTETQLRLGSPQVEEQEEQSCFPRAGGDPSEDGHLKVHACTHTHAHAHAHTHTHTHQGSPALENSTHPPTHQGSPAPENSSICKPTDQGWHQSCFSLEQNQFALSTCFEHHLQAEAGLQWSSTTHVCPFPP